MHVFICARAFDAAFSRCLLRVGEPRRAGTDAVELVAEDGGVVQRDEDKVLLRMILEAVRDAPLERLLLKLAGIGHCRVLELDAPLRDALRISGGGEEVLQER